MFEKGSPLTRVLGLSPPKRDQGAVPTRHDPHARGPRRRAQVQWPEGDALSASGASARGSGNGRLMTVLMIVQLHQTFSPQSVFI